MSHQLARNEGPASPRFDVCCVIDQGPQFFTEVVLWAICARQHLPADRYRLIVYVVGNGPADLIDWLENRDIEVRQAERPVPDSIICNAIVPFLDSHDADWVISTSSSLFFVRDPSPLFGSSRIRALPNDNARPPAETFRHLLAEAMPDRPYRPGFSPFPGPGGMRETHINNISSAMIAVPATRCRELADTWKKWALWLNEKADLLANPALFADKASFALAMEDLGEDVDFLPLQAGAILPSLLNIETPYALHIPAAHVPRTPNRFNENKTLRKFKLRPGAAEAIQDLNACIREAVREIRELPSARKALDVFLNPEISEQHIRKEAENDPDFDNQSFWNNRYTTNIALGSGVGSRGTNMRLKRELISDFLDEMKPESILDVGCGDFEVLSGIDLKATYLGLDVSSVVVERNRVMFPGKSFKNTDFAALDDVTEYEADVVFNFEVLIHQHTYDAYTRLVRNIVNAARKGGFISGYIQDPRPHLSSAIIAWHEPLTETLEKMGAKNIQIRAASPDTEAMCYVSFER
ncbi:class I SAM-dependent methyltransferase [Hyphomonas jannaschiana]|uniref:class I SAM-dependent methyltransferase n=1 Tax=Hyphomonas jannaschiana TaxID=86 RepID=UPI0035C6AF79